jgi:hypothetical protein
MDILAHHTFPKAPVTDTSTLDFYITENRTERQNTVKNPTRTSIVRVRTHQNPTLAFSKHIQSSIYKITTHKSSRSHNTLNTAAIAPRYTRSTYALSSAYFVASALSCK